MTEVTAGILNDLLCLGLHHTRVRRGIERCFSLENNVFGILPSWLQIWHHGGGDS